MTRDEYEIRIDEIKGACRDIVENLHNSITAPTPEDEADMQSLWKWLNKLQAKLGRFDLEAEAALEDIAELANEKECPDEDEDEDEDEDADQDEDE